MPNDLDQVAAAAPKNVKITSVRITLQALLNQTRKAREASAHIGMAGRKPHPAHYLVWRSSALKHLENPRQRLRVDVRIHPDASPVAKINLDQSSTRGRYGAHPAVTRRQKLRSFLHLRSDDLHRQKMVQPALMSVLVDAR
ncbi:hypothetical protein A1D31_38350 [Bradyrhizobium liaoningense]|nr:hypothetical protein A1D31_38350 [Bradyrhizobium liaoningense]